jgi:hypothetical protein
VEYFQLRNYLGYGATGYSDGLAAINCDGKWGYLDSEGKIAIPLIYNDAIAFNEGFGIVRKKITVHNDDYFVINKAGEVFPVQTDDIVDANRFYENRAPFVAKNGLSGYIDTTGKVVIEPAYETVGFFHNGLAWVRTNNDKIGYIDADGKWVISPKFVVAYNFDPVSGLARVNFNGVLCYTDTIGQLIYIENSQDLGDFSEGLAKVKIDGLYGYINNHKEWVIKPQFCNARNFKNGFASVCSNSKWGVLDTTGKWVIEPTFKEMKDVVLLKQ